MKKAITEKIVIASLTVVVAGGFLSCNDDGKSLLATKGESIRISADAKSLTRAVNTLDSLQKNGFALLAVVPGVASEEDPWFTNTVGENDSIVYGASEEVPLVTYSFSSGEWWLGNNPCYWPMDHSRKVCFFGWYGGNLDAEKQNGPLWSNDYVEEGAYGIYANLEVKRTNEFDYEETVESGCYSQDLMAVSDTSSMNESGNGSIQLNFEHIMAQLTFFVKCDGGADTVKLNSIEFQQPIEGFYDMESNEWVYSDSGTESHPYLSTNVCGDDDTRKNLTTEFQQIEPGDFGLYQVTTLYGPRFVFPTETTIYVSYTVKNAISANGKEYDGKDVRLSRTAVIRPEKGKVNQVYLTLPTDEARMIVSVSTSFIDWIEE